MKKSKITNPVMPFPQAEYGFYAGLMSNKGAVDAVQ